MSANSQQLNEYFVADFDAKMLGSGYPLDHDLDETILTVPTTAYNDAGLAIGDVFESVVAHDLAPLGFDLLSGCVIDIGSPGSGFAVAKVVDIPDSQGS